ncbi:MAG: hypothetical protein AAGN66_18050 [Acidobacteriota bacterium]
MQRLVTLPVLVLPLLWAAQPATAQDPPATDIYLAPVIADADTVELGPLVRVTDRDGYDNQPHFSPDGKTVYFTSIGEDGQADIRAYDVASGKSRAVTETPESEYSPTPVPGADALSVIRVEADGTQRLWRFPLDGGAPEPVLTEMKPVGYHAWLGDELVLFVLGEPHELRRASASEPDTQGSILAKDIGRSLHAIPGERAFSFVHKTKDGWWISRLDADDGTIKPLIEAFEGREDLTWSAEGMVWMADGTELHRWCSACGEGWWPVADLGPRGLGTVSRLAFSPDGKTLALVAERSAAPAPRPEGP